jgi:hypothetical protein
MAIVIIVVTVRFTAAIVRPLDHANIIFINRNITITTAAQSDVISFLM